MTPSSASARATGAACLALARSVSRLAFSSPRRLMFNCFKAALALQKLDRSSSRRDGWIAIGPDLPGILIQWSMFRVFVFLFGLHALRNCTDLTELDAIRGC
uniref:Putative secreted protein n=1 Tax=Anopheles triannulatus TaxID=58253 RepID=A0A2M4B3V2_9DIPT